MSDTAQGPANLEPADAALESSSTQASPALLRDRGRATELTPIMTAPMTIERAPQASGGPAALVVALNDTLRKTGLIRGRRLLGQVNQRAGFDCPGCAWPDAATRQGDPTPRLNVCESGVRNILSDHGPRRAGPRLFSTYTIPELAERSDHWHHSQGRLTQPLVRRAQANNYEAISWDAAIELVAEALAALPSPDRAWFYSSGRISNEASFCWQLLARELGTNNLATTNHLSHEASRVALEASLGTRRSGVTPDDLLAADAIFVFGQNPGSNHPRMLETLRAAKLRGAKIVAVNPLREVGLVRVRDPKRPRDWLGAGVELADLFVSVAVGGDGALIEAMAKAVIEADAVDHAFIEAHTEGYEALASTLAERSWAELVARSGVAEDQLRAAAKIYMEADAAVACWGLGLTQQLGGVETLEALVSLLLLRANVGRPGAGPLPVLGHSNSAGLWTMGVTPRPSDALLDGLERATGLTMPRAPGLDLRAGLAALGRGELDVVLNLGGNLLSAGPDSSALADALRRCRLTVHLSTKLDRGHLITGETGLILPCLGRSERVGDEAAPQWSSFEDACGQVRASAGPRPPIAAGLRSELEIIAAIAAAVHAESPIPWPVLGRDHARVRALIAAALPECAGFDGELQPGAPILLESPARARRFATHSGRAQLRGAGLVERPLPADGLWLTTVRSHDQHNSSVFWVGDRERGIHGYRRLILMNLDDMRRLGVEPYEQVELVSHFAGVERRAPKWVAVPHHVHPGCAAVYWPEANVLIPAEAVDPRSGTPSLKSVAVTISRGGLGAPSTHSKRSPVGSH